MNQANTMAKVIYDALDEKKGADIKMLASFDPVALDQACADLCNQMPVIDGSELDKNIKEMGHKHHDHFHMTHPDAEWETCLAHAEKIGLGTRAYELHTI